MMQKLQELYAKLPESFKKYVARTEFVWFGAGYLACKLVSFLL